MLLARRLVEAGVPIVQVNAGAGDLAGGNGDNWDTHRDHFSKMKNRLLPVFDRAFTALLMDLEMRGMLEETLVVFATEFGRTPGSQNSDGRDHHPFGFSVWMAGGGIRGGITHGATDEIGFHAVEHPHYVTDIHATLLRQLGLDNHALQVPGHQRLERDYGSVIEEILI